MITSITLAHIGQADDLTVAIPSMLGWTRITGPSGGGKSSIADAVAFAIWGTDRTGSPWSHEAIRDGAAHGTVTVHTGGQHRLIISRRLSRSKTGERGKVKRWTSTGGGPMVPSTTEVAMSAAIEAGAAGLGDPKRADIARAIMMPLGPARLADSSHSGEALRDLLVRVADLSIADIRATVGRLMEPHTLRDDDPTSPRGAEKLRRDVGAAVTRASGVVDGLAEALASAEERAQLTAGITEEQVIDARRVIEHAEVWAAYRHAYRIYEEGYEHHARDVDRVAEWDDGIAALGQRPSGNDGGIAEARGAVRISEDAHRAAQFALRAAEEQLSEVEAAMSVPQPASEDLVAAELAYTAADYAVQAAQSALAVIPDDDTCPTCGQPWAEVSTHRAEAQDELEQRRVTRGECDRQVIAARLDMDRAQEARLSELRATAAQIRSELEDLTEALTHSEHTLTAARESLESALAIGGDAAAWDLARRRLGERPEVGAAPVPPDEPDVPEPAADDIEQARETIRKWQRGQGAAGARVDDLEAMRRHLDEARGRLAEAKAEAERCNALVVATRAAPSEALRAWLPRLASDMVDVRLEGQSGAAIYVLGRPWRLASTGEQVVADLALRAAIRQADGRRYLPIVVDNAQDWSGEWPSVPGPVWLLTTAAQSGITAEVCDV